MVRATSGPKIFGGFDQAIPAEVDVPLVLCRRFGNTLRFSYRLALTLLLIRQLHAKTVGLAFWRESHERFMRIALFEKADPPCVRSEDLLSQNSAQFRLTTTFKLDEVLNLLVRAELSGLVEALRGPCILRRKRPRHLQCIRAIHPKVD